MAPAHRVALADDSRLAQHWRSGPLQMLRCNEAGLVASRNASRSGPLGHRKQAAAVAAVAAARKRLGASMVSNGDRRARRTGLHQTESGCKWAVSPLRPQARLFEAHESRALGALLCTG